MHNPTTSEKQANQPTSLIDRINDAYTSPLLALVRDAMAVHCKHHKLGEVQKSTLLSIKTGGCAENCSYCSQSAHFNTETKKTPLMESENILLAARKAKASGATRFCMGSSGTRIRNDETFATVLNVLAEVKAMGLETCLTMGMLDQTQANELKKNGLDYYNHNIDTSPEHYKKIVTTRQFSDRINTLNAVRKSGLKVCTGGILGMNETREDRVAFIAELVRLNPAPESLTVNRLVPIEGTPLADAEPIDEMEIVRTIACLRIFRPTSYIRLSAGRETMSIATQALCFLSGANSIFSGDKLLTTPNKTVNEDDAMFHALGLTATKQRYHDNDSK